MKNIEKIKRENRIKRHRKIRAKVFGTAEIPRLNIYRSNKGFFIQLIDDWEGITLISVGNKEIKKSKNKTDTAKEAGKLIAEKAKKVGIKKVIFDRGGYKYHGRVKAVADGARENGLEF